LQEIEEEGILPEQEEIIRNTKGLTKKRTK
jgi:hypothetical protein